VTQLVAETRDERRLGPDDDEIDAQLGGERHERRGIVRAYGVAARELGDPGIPRRGMQLHDTRTPDERPRERMLTAARPDEEHLHS